MKNKIEYFKEVALKLGHNVVLDIKNNLLQAFTNLWEWRKIWMKKKNKLKTRSRILRKVLETEPGWRVNVIVSDREFLGFLAELNPTQCTQICIIYRRLITYIVFFFASLPCTDILTLASKCLRDRTKIKGKKETHPSNPIFPGIMIAFSIFFVYF